jgi:hypothetical protein
MGWPIVWAFFSQTHLVTLAPTDRGIKLKQFVNKMCENWPELGKNLFQGI